MYVAGRTPHGGEGDLLGVWLSKLDACGATQWTRGHPDSEFGSVIVQSDAQGNVYVASSTHNAIPGSGSPLIDEWHGDVFDFDPHVRKFDGAGNVVWEQRVPAVQPEDHVDRRVRGGLRLAADV